MPYFKVMVIDEQLAASAVFAPERETTPTNIVATTITPRRNFDLNKLLIILFLTVYLPEIRLSF